MSFLSKLIGDANERYLKTLNTQVEKINSLEKKFEAFSAEEIKGRMSELRELHQKKGKSLNELLPEVFALTKEAAKRTLNQCHYDVQLKGGIVLHEGKIAEMKTGEGKTLTATLAIALNALSGRGVHVVTVNDYLAQRDAVWMGQVYHYLGFSVACIQQQNRSFIYDPDYVESTQKADSGQLDKERDTLGSFKVVHEFLRPCSRRQAYAADITYGTNNEFGFDYLRDNLVTRLEERTQRGFNYAIVDEVDSILIDEARTPLIISQPDEEATKRYQEFARIVAKLEPEKHYTVEEKYRAVHLTEEGINRVEKIIGIDDLYGKADVRLLHQLEQALKAKALFQLDRDYIVKDGEVVIVDEFTGRLMHGRRFSEGLHQAIEAKEGVPVQQESRTLATVTFQNYFRMYKKLAGMTGTAATNAEEFSKVYNLEVVVLPTHKPMVREDLPDQIYRNKQGKLLAVARKIKQLHEKGQPVLIGTVSIEKNEQLSKLLRRIGVAHEVLNAKNHEREAEIIAQAGRKGAVTVATNMAGRGVDIVLGGNPPKPEEARIVKELGGLCVIGTERHEARRIDNQLRGRAGRQGDPGKSQFYVSLEDDLMRIFAGDRVKSLMDRFNFPEDQPIVNRMVSRAIEKAQERIEGQNFDLRKYVLEYDDVMNRHRATIYKQRSELLISAETVNNPQKAAVYRQELEKRLEKVLLEEVEDLINQYLVGEEIRHWDRQAFLREVKTIFALPAKELLGPLIQKNALEKAQDVRDEVKEVLARALAEKLEKRRQELGETAFFEAVRLLWLRITDLLWMEHIEAMQHLRDAVRLRAYGQRDPLVEYKRESHMLFRNLQGEIRAKLLQTVFHVEQAPASPGTLQTTPLRFGRESMTTIGQTVGSENSTINAAGGSGFSASQAGRPPEADSRVNTEKVGRNQPCPCGSGKKYKKCHGIS